VSAFWDDGDFSRVSDEKRHHGSEMKGFLPYSEEDCPVLLGVKRFLSCSLDALVCAIGYGFLAVFALRLPFSALAFFVVGH
jgi:hypothetical protein